ncbi:hypothetical protein D9615_004170 [Tricholomella constricta]|uniref:Uncharacterized protein n=1 Tax=Tricholomella constricta TaxID=117010 RepID=A0A8H5HCM7_9AGAR|nr:hypothetical protein D9615_004170 [Tricholomella constricta]
MSVATPTLLPRQSKFPHLLPKPPQPHPVPLSHRRVYGNLNAVRDLQREMEDLSDEENELEDINLSIHNRGYSFLVPIGRSLTQQEEKNDADEDSEDSGSGRSGGAPSIGEDDGENESAQDLDASMEDLDGDATADSDDNDEMGEGDTEDFDDEPSEV